MLNRDFNKSRETRPFGKISVLVVGSFYQLPPLEGAKICVAEDGMLDNLKGELPDGQPNKNYAAEWRQSICRAPEPDYQGKKKKKAHLLSEDNKTLDLNHYWPQTASNGCPTHFCYKQVDTHNAAVVATLHTVIVYLQSEDYKRVTKTGNMNNQDCCVTGKKWDLFDL